MQPVTHSQASSGIHSSGARRQPKVEPDAQGNQFVDLYLCILSHLNSYPICTACSQDPHATYSSNQHRIHSMLLSCLACKPGRAAAAGRKREAAPCANSGAAGNRSWRPRSHEGEAAWLQHLSLVGLRHRVPSKYSRMCSALL